MNADTQESLDWWRENPLKFRDADVPYEPAIRSLGTGDAIVELRKQNTSRWTLYMRNADQVAVFTYAAIFSMADDYFSGNLIPNGFPIPEDLPSERIERFATWKCQYAYAMDTAVDKSLFHLQQMFEEHVVTVPGFNPLGLPRREYQSGNDPAYTWRYWMRAPMFLRVNSGEPKPPPPSHLHQWVIAAEKRSRIYRANPNRPRVFSFDGEVVSNIENSDPDTLRRGDVVMVHFIVSVVVTSTMWYTELIPVEVVRVVPVMRLVSDALESGPPTIDQVTRPALMEGERLAGQDRSSQKAVSKAAAVEPAPPKPVLRVRDMDRVRPSMPAPGPARSSRSSSSSSGMSAIASSVAAMDVDDVTVTEESRLHQDSGAEPFEDLGPFFDGKPPVSFERRSSSASASSTTRSDGSQDGVRRSSGSEDTRDSAGHPYKSGKRKRNVRGSPENSPLTPPTPAASDEESRGAGSRRGRRNASKSRR